MTKASEILMEFGQPAWWVRPTLRFVGWLWNARLVTMGQRAKLERGVIDRGLRWEGRCD